MWDKSWSLRSILFILQILDQHGAKESLQSAGISAQDGGRPLRRDEEQPGGKADPGSYGGQSRPILHKTESPNFYKRAGHDEHQAFTDLDSDSSVWYPPSLSEFGPNFGGKTVERAKDFHWSGKYDYGKSTKDTLHSTESNDQHYNYFNPGILKHSNLIDPQNMNPAQKNRLIETGGTADGQPIVYIGSADQETKHHGKPETRPAGVAGDRRRQEPVHRASGSSSSTIRSFPSKGSEDGSIQSRDPSSGSNQMVYDDKQGEPPPSTLTVIRSYKTSSLVSDHSSASASPVIRPTDRPRRFTHDVENSSDDPTHNAIENVAKTTTYMSSEATFYNGVTEERSEITETTTQIADLTTHEVTENATETVTINDGTTGDITEENTESSSAGSTDSITAETSTVQYCSLLDEDCLFEEESGTEDYTRQGRGDPQYAESEEMCKEGEDDDVEDCVVEDVQQELDVIKTMYHEQLKMEREIKKKLNQLKGRHKSKKQEKFYSELINHYSDNRTMDIANVYVTEIPVFDILQKQMIRVLQEREQFFRDIVKTVEENISLMQEWVQIARKNLLYKQEQGYILFGEFSGVSNVISTGFSTLLALTEQFFQAVESITVIKAQFINSFMSGEGGEEFLQRAQNFTVGELIPAKVNFILNAYNNSETIAMIFGDIVKNANILLETKYKVVESVINYGQNKMTVVREMLGTNLTFLELLNTVQRGTLLSEINVAPIHVRGNILSRYETEKIIGNLLAMGDPKLPVVGIHLKEMFANLDGVPVDLSGHGRQKYMDRWLIKQLSDAVINTFYTMYVKHGQAVLETSSPPVQLGNKCGLGFRFQGGKGRASIGRTSQVSVTAGPAFGYGRPPSLDIVTSAWLDTSVSHASKVSITAAKGVFGHCISKFTKLVNTYVSARAKSYISVKFSVINLKLESRVSYDPAMYGLEVPHIVIKFKIHLAGELYTLHIDSFKISNCHLKIMGITLFSYCGLIERILHREAKEATKRSLPFSSPRVLRQIEKAVMKRFGDEISIPLYVLEDRPVERFLNTANTIIKLGENLVRNVTSFQGQMTNIMKNYY